MELSVSTVRRLALHDRLMYACDHLNACGRQLGLPTVATEKEDRFLRELRYRFGAGAVIKRLRGRYAAAQAATPKTDA